MKMLNNCAIKMANIFYYLQEKYFKKTIFPFFHKDHAVIFIIKRKGKCIGVIKNKIFPGL